MTVIKFPTLFRSLLAGILGTALALQMPAVAKGADEGGKAERQRALDRSGKARTGEASYYSRQFHGRTMANGAPFDPDSRAAASKTLPLGTKAKVRNLENGKTAVVEIKDRGPYVQGRIIDLTPRTARQLGMREEGVVDVEVLPIEVPMPDGSTKRGAGARKRRD